MRVQDRQRPAVSRISPPRKHMAVDHVAVPCVPCSSSLRSHSEIAEEYTPEGTVRHYLASLPR